VLQEIVKESGGVIFNGNGYTAEWHAEAEKRGLPNLRTSVHALPVLESPEVVQLFDKYDVLTPRELHSRYEIYLEQYNKSVDVEAKLAAQIVKTQILPAALRYGKELADGIASAKAAGLAPSTKLASQVTKLTAEVEEKVAKLESAHGHGAASPLDEAKHLRDEVLPAMESLRASVDALEGVMADDLWPLPTYQEMLFIR
jgi:glutamine synthetase